MSVFIPESGCSAERESVGINSRIQEFNCERAVTYRIVLSAYLFKGAAGKRSDIVFHRDQDARNADSSDSSSSENSTGIISFVVTSRLASSATQLRVDASYWLAAT
jgi:hypothetical protein